MEIPARSKRSHVVVHGDRSSGGKPRPATISVLGEMNAKDLWASTSTAASAFVVEVEFEGDHTLNWFLISLIARDEAVLFSSSSRSAEGTIDNQYGGSESGCHGSSWHELERLTEENQSMKDSVLVAYSVAAFCFVIALFAIIVAIRQKQELRERCSSQASKTHLRGCSPPTVKQHGLLSRHHYGR